ncbi:MAG: DNA primase, partial [Candidatus Abyssobacteria bacterium SURF_5]
SPAWRAFLERIMGGNIELMAFLQRMCGYALTGRTSEQKLFFLYGTGANGKSTFLNTLLHVWGDYGRRMPSDLLFDDRRDSHPTALASLQGVRLAVTAEIEQGKRMAEVLVKELTGGDRLAARKMRQDYFEFEPTHKVFLAGNHLPIIRGAEHAIWRRIDLVPFRVQIPESEQDRSLAAKLVSEAAGILRWCVDGALDWRHFTLMEPDEVTAATGAYRSDMDILGDFLAECTKVEPGAQNTSSALSKAYNRWCEKNGERPLCARTLGMRLKERGYEQDRSGHNRTRIWKDIVLIEEDALL